MKNTSNVRFLILMSFALIVVSLTGCATIIQGGTQEIPIRSRPDGATVEVFDKNGSLIWTSATPAKAVLEKGDGFFSSATYRVVISKKGYRSQEVFLQSRLSMWYLAGNFVLGGPLGWLIIDPLTGAMWVLTPEIINAGLNESAAFQAEDGALVVMLLDEVPGDLMDSLTPVEVN